MTITQLGKSPTGATKWKVNVYASKRAGGDGTRAVRVIEGTKADALKVEAELIEQIAAGVMRHKQERARPLTMDRLIEQWVEERSPEWCARRGPDETARWNNHASAIIGSIRAEKLTARDLDRVYRTMRDKGLGQRSIELVHSQISAAFNLAIKWGQLSRNPTTFNKPAKPKRRKYPIPPLEDVGAAIDALEARGDNLHALLMLMAATTGHRRAELCALRWSDIDFGRSTLTITRAMAYTPGIGWEEMDWTKSDTISEVPLLPRVVAGLQQLQSDQRSMYAALELPYDSSQFVFTVMNQFGKLVSITPGALSQWWGRNRAKLGLDGVNWHDLRHWSASRLFGSGADLRKVQDWLGHRSPSTTQGYIHMIGGEDRNRLLMEAFGGFEQTDEVRVESVAGDEVLPDVDAAELGPDDITTLAKLLSDMASGKKVDARTAALIRSLSAGGRTDDE